jgi:hypothetical protein
MTPTEPNDTGEAGEVEPGTHVEPNRGPDEPDAGTHEGTSEDGE